jgi:hypothetical protein
LRFGEPPEAGLSDREIIKRAGSLDYQMAVVPAALARGDISVIREELDELLNAFQLNVDRKSASYRKLGMAVLKAHVRALKDIERRNSGEPVELQAASSEHTLPPSKPQPLWPNSRQWWSSTRSAPDRARGNEGAPRASWSTPQVPSWLTFCVRWMPRSPMAGCTLSHSNPRCTAGRPRASRSAETMLDNACGAECRKSSLQSGKTNLRSKPAS